MASSSLLTQNMATEQPMAFLKLLIHKAYYIS